MHRLYDIRSLVLHQNQSPCSKSGFGTILKEIVNQTSIITIGGQVKVIQVRHLVTDWRYGVIKMEFLATGNI